MLGERDLRPFQRFFAEKIEQCFVSDPKEKLPGLVLALEPGAGKTVTVLTALRRLLDQFAIRKALIVAPLLVAQTTWPDEFEEWEHLRATTRTLIRVEEDDRETKAAGDAAYAVALARWQAEWEAEVAEWMAFGDKRRAAEAVARARWTEAAKARQTDEERERGVKPKVTPSELADVERAAAVASAKAAKLARLAAEDTEVHIINKEAFVWLFQHFGNGAHWPYDVIICDDLREGRSGKKRNPRGKKEGTKGPAPLTLWGTLARARKHVMATIQLTGTPTPTGLHNMWGLIGLIDHGERLGSSKTKFEQRWFDVCRYSYKVTPRPHAFDEIMASCKDVMFSLDPADMPQLPPYIVDPIKVRLPDAVLEEYRRFERTLVSEEYDVEAVNAGVRHSKLLQMANGSAYREDGDDVWIHDCKIAALRDLVERLNGTPLLVAYTFQFDVDRILKAFPKAVLLRPENAAETKRLWNADKIPLLLAHRASAGHGLNLQKGVGHMCEYGLTSDAELYLQFKKRLHRPGREDKVVNHVIIAEGTIDEEIWPMYLDPKIATQERILQKVRVSFQSDGDLLG